MLNIIRKSANILKNNFLFTQPVLVCLFFVMTALTCIINSKGLIVPRVILIISTMLFTVCFITGSLYINKFGVIDYNRDDSREEVSSKSIKNFKKFFEGIGTDIFRILPACIVLIFIYAFVLYFTAEICLKVFGEPKLIQEFPKFLKASSQAEILNIMNSFSDTDKIVFSYWAVIFNTVISVLNYFSILYFSVLSFDGKNIFVSLVNTVIFFFKNILDSVLIMIIAFVLYIVLNIFSLVLGTSSFGFVILIILFTMYLNYYLILVFCLYYDKTKNNSNSRTECIGEDQTFN